MHPAAKLLVMASAMQEKEIGDGSNFVIVFAGELLAQAEHLRREAHQVKSSPRIHFSRQSCTQLWCHSFVQLSVQFA